MTAATGSTWVLSMATLRAHRLGDLQRALVPATDDDLARAGEAIQLDRAQADGPRALDDDRISGLTGARWRACTAQA